jgi:hypothetical protein
MYTLSAKNGCSSNTIVGPKEGNSLGWVGEFDGVYVGRNDGMAEGEEEIVGALLKEGVKDGCVDMDGSKDGSCDGSVLGNKEMVGGKDDVDGGREPVGDNVNVGFGVMVG